MKLTYSLLAIGLCGLIPPVCGYSQNAASLSETSRVVPGYLSSAETPHMPAIDFDGDGAPEIAAMGRAYFEDKMQAIIQIFGHSSSDGWALKQSIIPASPEAASTFGACALWIDQQGPHLLFAQPGDISVYSGWPLRLERRFSIDSFQFSDAVVADVDGDGKFELIETTPGWTAGYAIQAYSLENGERLWLYSNPGFRASTALVVQLDEDPALEIVTGRTEGIVLDGASHQAESQNPVGFGGLLLTGQYGVDGPRFVGFSEERLQAFLSQPWLPGWFFATGVVTEAISADTNRDGIDDIIYYSVSGSAGLNIFDVASRSVRRHYDNKPLVIKLAAGDFNHDSSVEIAISNGRGSPPFPTNVFEVIDAETGVLKFGAEAHVPGPYVSSNFLADTEANEIVIGSAEPTTDSGAISRINVGSGSVTWRTPPFRPPFDTFVARSMFTTRIAGMEFPVVLASGKSRQRGSGLLLALDSRDGHLLWTLSSDNNAQLPLGADFGAISVIDSDRDGLSDSILVCTDEPRLRQFRLADRVETWASSQLESKALCQGMLEISAGESKMQVAALTGGLHAFDADTHEPQWTIPYDQALFLSSYIPTGSTGAEIAVVPEGQRNSVDFFSVATHNWLRRIDLSSPGHINAIAQPPGLSIHELLIAAGDRIFVVDGETGEMRAGSDFIGEGAGAFNELAIRRTGANSFLVGLGSSVAILAYELKLSPDPIFSSGFDSVPQ